MLGPRGSLAGLVPRAVADRVRLPAGAQPAIRPRQLPADAPADRQPDRADRWPVSLPFPFNDDFEPHAHFLPSSFYWYVGVVVIIAVHIAAVLVAHRRLGGAVPDSAAACAAERASRPAHEYPWLVAMVAYTMAILWLIAQPFTESTPRQDDPIGLGVDGKRADEYDGR